jgi:thioredoxin 1
MPILLTDQNFEKEIINADKLALVDFYADWCEPCSVLAPILEKLADDFKEKLILMKADINRSPLFSQKFGVEQIPTVIIFKEGKPISGFVGLSSQTAIKEWIENIIKEDDPTDKQAKNNPIHNSSEELHDNAGWHGKTSEELIKEFAEYAEKNNIKLNPDKEVVKRIAGGLLENEKKYGKKYCPCRRVTGNAEEDEKKICPCYYYKNEIKKDGRCFCGLFFQ